MAGWSDNTAAKMPAVPAPKTATLVLRHVVLDVEGDVKVGPTSRTSDSAMDISRASTTMTSFRLRSWRNEELKRMK